MNPDPRYQSAQDAYARGEIAVAIWTLREILKSDPTAAIVRSDLAAILYQLGNLDSAYFESTQAFALRPTDSVIASNHLECLIAKGESNALSSPLLQAITGATDNRALVEQLRSHIARRHPEKELRLLLLYDVKGWAWWHRSQAIAKHIGHGIAVDIRQLAEPFDHRDYDFILPYDHNILHVIPSLQGVPCDKLLIGNSCPIYIFEAEERRRELQSPAGIVNNYTAWSQVKDLGPWYCCQNGVDLELFQPARTFAPKKVACWVGNSRSVGQKGLSLIQEACQETGYHLHFLDVVSPTEERVGHTQEQLRDLVYHKASVYICASEYEGTPNPGLEALACGIPVISTRVGNMPELLVDGVNGWLVERSAAAIADALRKHERLDQEALRAAARKSIEDGWAWENRAKRYGAALRDISATKTERQQLGNVL